MSPERGEIKSGWRGVVHVEPSKRSRKVVKTREHASRENKNRTEATWKLDSMTMPPRQQKGGLKYSGIRTTYQRSVLCIVRATSGVPVIDSDAMFPPGRHLVKNVLCYHMTPTQMRTYLAEHFFSRIPSFTVLPPYILIT